MTDFSPAPDLCLNLSRKENPTNNWLLDALPDADYERLKPYLRQTSVRRGRVLYEIGDPIHSVYFPTQGMISLVLTAQCGNEVEVRAVGPEGMVGIMALLGGDRMTTRAIVQIAGTVLWVPTEVISQEFKADSTIQFTLRCYLRYLLYQSFQTTLCNRLHKVEERLARWLLTTSERTQLKKLPLTQEFISNMLGTRRASVTEACAALERAGIIEHTRGSILILDCDALEARACECYATVCAEMQRIYGRK